MDMRRDLDAVTATNDKDWGEFISYRTYTEDQLEAGYRRDEQLREFIGELRSDVATLRRGDIPPTRPSFLPGPPHGSPPPRRAREEDDGTSDNRAPKRARAVSPTRTDADVMDTEAPLPYSHTAPAAAPPTPAPTPRADLTPTAADGDPGVDSCITCIIGEPVPNGAVPFVWGRDSDNLKAVQDMCVHISPLCPPPVVSFDRKGTVSAVFRYFKFVDRARFISFMSFWRARPAAYKSLVAIAVPDDNNAPAAAADATPSLGALLREHTSQARTDRRAGDRRAGDRHAGQRRPSDRHHQS